MEKLDGIYCVHESDAGGKGEMRRKAFLHNSSKTNKRLLVSDCLLKRVVTRLSGYDVYHIEEGRSCCFKKNIEAGKLSLDKYKTILISVGNYDLDDVVLRLKRAMNKEPVSLAKHIFPAGICTMPQAGAYIGLFMTYVRSCKPEACIGIVGAIPRLIDASFSEPFRCEYNTYIKNWVNA